MVWKYSQLLLATQAGMLALMLMGHLGCLLYKYYPAIWISMLMKNILVDFTENFQEETELEG